MIRSVIKYMSWTKLCEVRLAKILEKSWDTITKDKCPSKLDKTSDNGSLSKGNTLSEHEKGSPCHHHSWNKQTQTLH